MGWWKIKDVETGQVDVEAQTAAETANAIPGEEDAGCSFGGDGPADLMGATLRAISTQYREAWGRYATRDELTACFNFCANAMFKGWWNVREI